MNGPDVVRTVGERVRVLRDRAGLPQDRLAKRAGLSVDVVRALEQGRATGIHVHTLTALATALRVPISVLVGERPMPNVDAALLAEVRRQVEQLWEVA